MQCVVGLTQDFDIEVLYVMVTVTLRGELSSASGQWPQSPLQV